MQVEEQWLWQFQVLIHLVKLEAAVLGNHFRIRRNRWALPIIDWVD